MAEREPGRLTWLGIRSAPARSGEVALEMDCRPDMADDGRIHRGFLALLAQSALEAAIEAGKPESPTASGLISSATSSAWLDQESASAPWPVSSTRAAEQPSPSALSTVRVAT